MNMNIKQSQSQDSKKIWNYLSEMTKSSEFTGKVEKIRKKYDIPKKGYKFKKDVDSPLIPPRNWMKKIEANKNNIEYFYNDLEQLSLEIGIHPFEWNFEHYIFFNRLYTPKKWEDSTNMRLCKISDISKRLNDRVEKELLDLDNEVYPIAINISPYATKRDIIDFINREYIPEIKLLQNEYKKDTIKIGRYRNKSLKIQKRNDFIYTQRSKPRKIISKYVRLKFGDYMDYGHIGKIISLEKNKRK
jgi:hypothetical protein